MARSAKLRIGIVVDGRLVAERLVGRGESLALGSGRGELPVAGWNGSRPLLRADATGWVLLVPAGAAARVSVDGATQRKPGPAEVRLSGWVRGKLELPGAVVLFQAVESVVAPPVTAPRLRPRLVQQDDALLVGLVPMFTALGLLAVAFAPPPQEETVATVIEEYEGWIAVPPPPRPVEVRPVDVPGPDAAPDPEPAPPRPAPPARRPSGPGGGDASDLEVIAMLTQGEAVGGLLSSGSPDDIEAALRNLGGAPARASAGADGPRGGPGGTGSDAEIALGLIGDPRGSEVADLATALPREVIVEEPETPPASDYDAVRSVVTGHRGQLKWCYEQRAKVAPDLQGRVEVAWMVRDGRVTAAEVLVDGTGDPELAECVVDRVRSWRFPREVEGEVTWPFLFRPKE